MLLAHRSALCFSSHSEHHLKISKNQRRKNLVSHLKEAPLTCKSGKRELQSFFEESVLIFCHLQIHTLQEFLTVQAHFFLNSNKELQNLDTAIHIENLPPVYQFKIVQSEPLLERIPVYFEI